MRRCLIMAFIILTINGYSISVSALEEKEGKEKCLKDFNINTINLKDPKTIRDIPLLAEYFQCRSAARNDIKECDNLNPWSDRVSTCRHYFDDYHAFYGRLLRVGRATPLVLTDCVKNLGLDIEVCSSFAQAWLTDDISFCERYRGQTKRFNECKALISGDTALCSDDSCMNRATYYLAIKTGGINSCKMIRDHMAESMCQGYISMDEKICEKNEGFKEFRNRYCK